MTKRQSPSCGWLTAVAAVTALSACRSPAPQGVANGPTRGVAETTGARAEAAKPKTAETSDPKMTVFARAEAHAIATDAEHVYFGDQADDVLYAAPKSGGDPVRLARRAPIRGGLSVDGPNVVWIGSPGNIVMRVDVSGGHLSTLRDRGIFVGALASGRDVFVLEAVGAGGAVTRVTGATAARIASFATTPRGLTADSENVFVATTTKILRAPRERGPIVPLATLQGPGMPVVDDAAIYATGLIDQTAEIAPERVVVRVSKTGGDLRVLARDVRAAPIGAFGGDIYFFSEDAPVLRRVPVAGGSSVVIARDDAFGHVNAIAVDADAIFVATGTGSTATVLTTPRQQTSQR